MSIDDDYLARCEDFPRPGTPGPWVVSRDHGYESAEIVCMAPGHGDYLKDIALNDGRGEIAGEWRRDFRTIAAAPEIREAIDVLVGEVRRLRAEGAR